MKSTVQNKNAEISARILKLVAGGASVIDAIDTVLGNGTSEALISDLYSQLRAKACGTRA